LAQILAHQARYREAREACQRVLQIEPGSSAALASMQQIVPALGTEGDISEVREKLIEAYRTVLEARPDDVETWLSLGAGLDMQSRQAAAQSQVAALQHAEAGGQTGIATPIPLREAPETIARRLVDDEDVVRISDLAGHVEKLEQNNAALARLISAQHERLGYLDSLENWARYEHTKIYFRNLGLYTRKFDLRGAVPEPAQSIPETLLPRFTSEVAARAVSPAPAASRTED
jgi:tetratricopeptide (TPR) repeat protein